MKGIDKDLVSAPLDEGVLPRKRTESAIKLSELVLQVVTHVICHAIVNCQELLKEERMSVAHAFLQRGTSTHLCNHKLTSEGIALDFQGQSFSLHEEYKTMTLTRSVYEHLAMFYFLYEQPRNAVERDVVWKYWQINGLRNGLDYDAGDDADALEEQRSAMWQIERLRTEILAAPIGSRCRQRLDEWTKTAAPAGSGSIRFITSGGMQDVRRVSYSKAWRFLFGQEEMAAFYGELCMHCHPVYQGLMQYQSQSLVDEGNDGLPLYFSCSFLARLCRLFLKQMPEGEAVVKGRFGKRELAVFNALSRLGNGR